MNYDKLSALGIRLRRRSGQEKTTCPQCSENRRNKKEPCLSVNITEGTYNCHHCGWKGNVRAFRKDRAKEYTKPDPKMLELARLNQGIVDWYAERKISKQTIEKFFIHGKTEWMPGPQKNVGVIVYPFIRDGSVVNAKYRSRDKSFRLIKDAELIFFGMQTLPGRRCAIIVEGESDLLAAYESGFANEYDPMPDAEGEVVEHELGRWAILSVPNGASKGQQQLDFLENCSEWLINIEEFIIATDNDEAGDNLKMELVRRLGIEKCRVLDWSKARGAKDLNEVLIKYGKEKVQEILLTSDVIPVDGVYQLGDIFEQMLSNFKKGVQLAPPTMFSKLDEYFRWKKGDINLFIGYANWGKTFFALQLMLTKSIWDGWKWAVFSPENYPAHDFFDDLVEMYAGKWIKHMTEDEYSAACKFINEHIFYVYPEDEHDIENIHEKFRYLILRKGIDGVMIDPFNQLDKNQKAYERDDQYLSGVLKDIKRFALVNHVCYNIVTHPKNPTYEKDKALPVCGMYDIAGGAMWGNKSDQILSYHRPEFHNNPNSKEVMVRVLKVKRKRTGGQLGDVDLFLDWEKKRFTDPVNGEMPCDPKAAELKKKKSLNDYKQPELPDENGWTERNTFLPYKDDNETEIGF